ncbi:hypothetical protein EV359DRAFT_62321 [Lentinula novae-zelandiae]|nr:hypothetical protein EV359DRAFT_62321 [Lentinula novae-zelandiae]
MILAMRLLLFWIPMVQISSVQSQNVNLPIRRVLDSNVIVSFIHSPFHHLPLPLPRKKQKPQRSSKASITSSAVTSSSSVMSRSNVAPLVVDSTQTLYTTSTSTLSQILHTTRTPSHTEPTSTSKPSHLGAIIGGIVGGVAFAFIIALIALLDWHRRRQRGSVQKPTFNGDMMVKPPFKWRNVARSWKSRSIASSLPRRWRGSDYGYGGYSSSAVTSEDLVPKNGLAEKNGNAHKPPSEIEGDNGVL